MARISPGQYRIESLGNPGSVLDLRGSNPAPGTDVICYPNTGNPNQIWKLESMPGLPGTFSLQAVDPPSNIVCPSPNPGTTLIGLPNEPFPLQMIPTAEAPDVFHITSPIVDGLVFQAHPPPGDPAAPSPPVTLERPNPELPAQQWRFRLS